MWRLQKGYTPFMAACEDGNIEAAKWLIRDHKVDIKHVSGVVLM